MKLRPQGKSAVEHKTGNSEIKAKWTIRDIPSLKGKIIVVTGANSGIGFETARALALHDATVVMAVRNKERGLQARNRIIEEASSADVHLLHLDLVSLREIRNFAKNFQAQFNRLDVLINNAGVMQTPKMETEDGFDYQVGINYLGHFALTGLLLPVIRKTSGARVVTVSSLVHKRGEIDLDDFNFTRSYGKMKAYARSKLANLLFSFELGRLFRENKIDAISVAAHPGYASTALFYSGNRLHSFWRNFIWVFKVGNFLFAQSARKGALPSLFAATDPRVRDGDFIGPSGLFELRGHPKFVRPSKKALDPEVARGLWELSEKLTGVSYCFSGSTS